jgi:hypothetical protein
VVVISPPHAVDAVIVEDKKLAVTNAAVANKPENSFDLNITSSFLG